LTSTAGAHGSRPPGVSCRSPEAGAGSRLLARKADGGWPVYSPIAQTLAHGLCVQASTVARRASATAAYENPIQHAEGALVGPRMQMQPGDARSVYSRSFVGSWARD
jgi:hypothetical protein